MMVMRFSTLSAPKEKEEHERRECGKMADGLLLQTQPRPHSSNNPLWSTVLSIAPSPFRGMCSPVSWGTKEAIKSTLLKLDLI